MGRSGANYITQVAPPSGSAATDTANIQTALDNANTAGGGVVQLGVGTYLIQAGASASLGGVRVNNNTALAGMGMGVTTLKVVNGTTLPITGVVRTPSGVQNSKVMFRDFTIDGNKAGTTGNPLITGFFSGVTPNSSQTDTDIRVIRVECMNCYEYGFDPHERTTRLYMDGCVSHDNGGDNAHDGFTLDGCYDSAIVGCISYSNGRHGFNLVTASNRVTLTNCEAYGNTSNGFTLQNGAKHNTLSGCRAYNNTLAGYVINGVAQSGQQDNVAGQGNQFIACEASTNGTHGFQLVGALNNTFTNCVGYDNSQTTTNTSDHFRIDETGSNYSTNNTFTNCTWYQTTGVTNAAKYGFQEISSNDGPNTIIGCSGSGTATSTILCRNNASLLQLGHNGSANAHPWTPLYTNDVPSTHGWLDWNFPIDMLGSGTGVNGNAGVINLMKVTRQNSSNFSKITVVVGTAGSGLTSNQCFAAVFNSSGTRLAVTADLSAVLNTTGVIDLTLTSTVSTTLAGDDLYVALLTNGTTQPSYVRSGSTGAAGPNAGFSAGAGNLRFSTYGSAQTTMPSSLTMANMLTTNALTVFVALKA